MGWLLQQKGHCVYCDRDLLTDDQMMLGLYTDHLLCKKLYPELDFKCKDGHILNAVPACAACNALKRDFDSNMPLLYNSKDGCIRDCHHQEQIIKQASEEITKRRNKFQDIFEHDRADWLEAVRQWHNS